MDHGAAPAPCLLAVCKLNPARPSSAIAGVSDSVSVDFIFNISIFFRLHSLQLRLRLAWRACNGRRWRRVASEVWVDQDNCSPVHLRMMHPARRARPSQRPCRLTESRPRAGTWQLQRAPKNPPCHTSHAPRTHAHHTSSDATPHAPPHATHHVRPLTRRSSIPGVLHTLHVSPRLVLPLALRLVLSERRLHRLRPAISGPVMKKASGARSEFRLGRWRSASK